jgi:hypothetical protein
MVIWTNWTGKLQFIYISPLKYGKVGTCQVSSSPLRIWSYSVYAALQGITTKERIPATLLWEEIHVIISSLLPICLASKSHALNFLIYFLLIFVKIRCIVACLVAYIRQIAVSHQPEDYFKYNRGQPISGADQPCSPSCKLINLANSVRLLTFLLHLLAIWDCFFYKVTGEWLLI